MKPRPLLLAVAAASVLLLTACGEEAGTRENLIETLADPAGDQEGLSRSEAECVAERLYAELSGDEAEAVAGADSAADVSAAAEQLLRNATQECTAGAGGD